MMKAGIMTIVLVTVFVSVLLLTGCSSEDHPTSAPEEMSVEILIVTPANGATDVSPCAPITMKFSGSVDTASVMRNFYFTGGMPMHEWLDSLNHYGGFGMMGMMHSGHMMHWLDSIEIDGEFHWNSAFDSCTYAPDSAMTPTSEYLCLLYEGGMHDHGGGMMGGADQDDSGYHMFEFMTGPGN